MRILCIGNSFSQDANRWLHAMAEDLGLTLTCVNLYIGGCSLQRHYENMCSGEAAYQWEENGIPTGRTVSLQEALAEGGWDCITLQQASHFSGLYETYTPYLEELAAFVRAHAPGAGLMIHQTWAYEIDSTHEGFAAYHRDQDEMYAALCDAYDKASRAIGVPLIPGGRMIQALRGTPPFDVRRGGRSLCRDGFHLSLLYGRFALAALWLKTLTHADLRACRVIPTAENETADPALLQYILAFVQDMPA